MVILLHSVSIEINKTRYLRVKMFVHNPTRIYMAFKFSTCLQIEFEFEIPKNNKLLKINSVWKGLIK